MRSGRLRHRVEIKQRTVGRDAAGGSLQTLSLIASTRGHIAPATGREFWAAQHVATEYDAVISMRFRTDITEEMELHIKDRVYDVKSIVDPTGYGRELKVLCVNHV